MVILKKSAFDRLDCDGSGYVSKEDLKEFLGNSATAKEIADIIKEGDKDKDGDKSACSTRKTILRSRKRQSSGL
jgi:Ca2+-binding EF-hand superfamily protein